MNQLLSQPAVKIVLTFLQATPAVPILFVLMVFDVLTGFAAGYLTRKLNSSVSWKGMTRKTVVVLLVGVGVAIDPLTPQVPEASFVALFFVANELLSILENAVLCGVPMPPALVSAMIKVREFTTSDKRLATSSEDKRLATVDEKEQTPP